LSIANLAQFRAKFGVGTFSLFVFGRNQKSGVELRNGPVVLNLVRIKLLIASCLFERRSQRNFKSRLCRDFFIRTKIQ
jgi:hypothetical protein